MHGPGATNSRYTVPTAIGKQRTMNPNAQMHRDASVHEVVMRVAADPKRGYPSGELVFSIVEDGNRARVGAMALHLGDRRPTTTAVEEYDDGCVLVRRGQATGELAGLQILRYAPGPASVPELMADIVAGQQQFLLDAVATGMVAWALIDKACEALNASADLREQWMAAGGPTQLEGRPLWPMSTRAA
jgi:hypothetical protein